MIAPCRQCHKLVDMTTEEANTPLWCCAPGDRLCWDCWVSQYLGWWYCNLYDFGEKLKTREVFDAPV